MSKTPDNLTLYHILELEEFERLSRKVKKKKKGGDVMSEFEKIKKERSEEKVLEPPTICPLLSIAAPKEDEWSDCEKERCWWFNRKLQKCVWVHIAISLAQIADMRGRENIHDLIKKP